MTRYNAQTRVAGGYFLNTTTWSIQAIEGVNGLLPGTPGTQWVRLPLPVMVVAALVLSFGFVIFLPAIGLGLFAWVVAKGTARALRPAMTRLGHAIVHAAQVARHGFPRTR